MITARDRIQRFVVLERLGVGGMGEVFRAHDPQLERDVAIKLVASPAPNLGLDERVTLDLRSHASAISNDDLLREAKMMAQLAHPNVCALYEAGLTDGGVFLVMECVTGTDLRNYLKAEHGRDEVLDVLAQAARGLAAAHARGILHRDFKPENVLIGADGRARVADFGLSQLLGAEVRTVTRIETVAGTPRYMAPELFTTGVASMASDVYAFCVTFAEAMDVKLQRADAGLAVRGVPRRLRRLVIAGLDADPVRRPGIAEISKALDTRSIRAGRLVAVLAVAVAAVAALAIPRRQGAVSCEPRADHAGWTALRRVALEVALGVVAGQDRQDAIASTVKNLDAAGQRFDDGWRAVCRDAAAGTVTRDQLSVRRSCLTRRALELDATVDRAIDEPALDPKWVGAQLAATDDCADVTAPPIAVPAFTAELYRKFAALCVTAFDADREVALDALARVADAVGERELATRARLALSPETAHRLAPLDEALARAYHDALDIGSKRLQAAALIERAHLAEQRNDVRAAGTFAQLALDAADRPTTPPDVRAWLYAQLGHAEANRGDASSALAKLDKALALVSTVDAPQVDQLNLRFDRAHSLAQLQGRQSEAMAANAATLEWARSHLGPHSTGYAVALNVYGADLEDAGERERGAELRSQALAVMIAAAAPGSPRVEMQRLDTAFALEEAGHFEDARRELAHVIAASERDERLKDLRMQASGRLGVVLCDLGRWAEGLPMIERSIAEHRALYGPSHVRTTDLEERAVDIDLSIGHLADAQLVLDDLIAALEARSEAHDVLVAIYRAYYQGLIDRADHRSDAALARARATLDRLHGDAYRRPRQIMLSLVADLELDLDQLAAADRALAEARALALALHSADNELAKLDASRARSLALHHDRAGAIALARTARAVLARYPLSASDVADIDRLLR